MSVKGFIKRILPRVFLKKAFTIYNTAKIFTVDKIIFPEYDIKRKQFLLYRKGYPFRENAIVIDDISDTKVKSYMQMWYDWTQEEFILIFDKPCCIEPDYGWAICSPNRLIYYSLGISRTLFQPKPKLFKFWSRKEIIKLQHAISLRDTGEENYFHFYNDVLAKLFFLKENAIDILNTSIVISKKLWDKPFLNYCLNNHPELNLLNWVIQDKEYIQCDRTIFCKPLTHREDLLKRIFSPLYKAISGATRKIFLTRNKFRMRSILNSEEIEELFIQKGFEIVDSDHLRIEQQIEIFASASIIVGVHGAGLTNLMFRNGECRILEIFPFPENGYLPFHYIMLAKMKGFAYQAVIGEKSKTGLHDGFYVNTDKLRDNLAFLLS